MSVPEHSSGHDAHWLSDVLHDVGHHLPDQGPIHVFVHHNTLHALQHLPFHDALVASHEMDGGPGYRSPAFYRQEYARGRINESDLKEALSRFLGERANEKVGPLTLFEIYRLVLVHGIAHQTVSSLNFALHESHEHLRLRADLPPKAEKSLRESQIKWCKSVLSDIGKTLTVGEAVMLLSGEPVIEKTRERFWDNKAFANAAHVAKAFSVSEQAAKELIERASELRGEAQGALAWLYAEHSVVEDVLADIFEIGPSVSELSALIEKGDDRIVAASLWGAIRKVAHRDYAPRPTDQLLARVGVDRTHIEALAAFVVKDPRELVTGELIPLCAAFLDDGSATTSMPYREKGFLEAVRHYYCDTSMPLPAWADSLPKRLRKDRAAKLSAHDIIERRLDELGVERAHAKSYLTRLLMHLPGWAGMFARLERKPDEIRFGKRPVRLADYVAVGMTMGACAMEWAARTFLRHRSGLRNIVSVLKKRGIPPAHDPPHKLGEAFAVFQLCKLAGIGASQIDEAWVASLSKTLENLTDWTQSRIYLEAYEIHYYREVVGGLLANAQRAGKAKTKAERPILQLVTCIDEREESFRRHFEEAFPEGETFGVAGFFGLPIAYRGLDEADRAPLCPVVVTPAHAITEIPSEGQDEAARVRAIRRSVIGRLHWSIEHLSQSGVGAALLAPFFGVAALVAMAARLIVPKWTEHAIEFAEHLVLPRPKTELTPTRAADEKVDGLWDGFSLAEETERVAATLRNIGLVRNFAPIVALMGHGSHCLNNPHFSAHDCGACGGRPGYANARLFARTANKPEVRERLRKMGIDIPDDTIFIGGLHNTASDDIVVAPIEGRKLSSSEQARVKEAIVRLERAASLSAHERCRRFENAPRSPTPEQAFRHVQKRSADFGQPRPELGHMTNASCVVGRRTLSRGVFLDRRAFLVSYDPSIDPEVAILERILAAVGPVGAGISLEYYFSTTDNLHYGCGTKLPHNPASNLGVMEGSIGDLRTGLPKQMIEFHEPMRLLLVVEATTEALLHVVGRQPEVAELVTKGWVIVVSIHPETREAFEFIPGRGFVPFSLGDQGTPKHVPNSMAWYGGHPIFEHLPVALVESPARATQAA